MIAKDIEAFINRIAPFDLACEWDNVGLCIGRKEHPVQKVLLSLDMTFDVIDEAIEWGADMLLTHHPLFLKVDRKILLDDDTQEKAFRLLSHNINFLAAHTNYDGAPDGMNAVLARVLGLQNIRPLVDTRNVVGLDSKQGEVPAIRYGDFLEHVKKTLRIPHVKYVGDPEELVSKVAVIGGSGGDFVRYLVDEELDVLVTADVKYHEAQYAFEHGKKIVDAGHFETENPGVPYLKKLLEEEFGDALTLRLSERYTKSFWNYD